MDDINQCNLRELSTAYREAALRIHPDKVEEAKREIATLEFQTLANAYETLRCKQPHL